MRLFIILSVCLLSICSCKKDVYYNTSAPIYRIGDDPAWAGKQLNNAAWSSSRRVAGNRIFWARLETTITHRLDLSEAMGIKITAFGAYEFYWDGVLIGRNGRPLSASAREVPGTETARFVLPDSLARPGQHVAAFRLSQSYHQNDLRHIEIDLQNYAPMLRTPLLIAMFMHLLAGIFLITALYYFSLYFNSKYHERSMLVFAVTCFLFFALLGLEYLVEYLPVAYNWYFARAYAISGLTLAISFSVPYYFAIRFAFKQLPWLITVLLSALFVIAFFNYRAHFWMDHLFSYVMWLTSAALAVWAIAQRVSGAKILLVALLASAVIQAYALYDIWLFSTYALIAMCMLYLQGMQMKKLEENYQTSMALSSRLKLELLKKHIQPHFIKNTLTSMIDWIEDSPKDGALFLHALAREFDILNKIADETLVPVGTEIELCRTHLHVMQFRKEINYSWEDMNIFPAETLPPAILHTMVENGITHSLPGTDNRVAFRLSYERTKTGRKFTLTVIAGNRGNLALAGTGFRYITSRLTESYGNNWSFTSNAVPQGWQNIINIAEA